MEAFVVVFIYFSIANLTKQLVCYRYSFQQRYHCWYLQSLSNTILSGILFFILFIAEHGVSIDEPVHRFFVIYLSVSVLSVFLVLIYHIFFLLKRKYYTDTRSRFIIFAIVLLILLGAQSLYYQDKTYNAISDACYDASYANSLEKRKAYLEEGYRLAKKPGLFLPAAGWSNPIKVCNWTQKNLTNMLEKGVCTDVLLNDVACQCGNIHWDPENPVIHCFSKTQCYKNNNEYIIQCNSALGRMW